MAAQASFCLAWLETPKDTFSRVVAQMFRVALKKQCSVKILKIWTPGPVVQSIVSLTKSLVNDPLSLLVRLRSSVLIFFAEKM